MVISTCVVISRVFVNVLKKHQLTFQNYCHDVICFHSKMREQTSFLERSENVVGVHVNH